MADLHKAIRAIHNNVITIQGDTKEDIVALDNSGNNVTINWTNVEAWTDPNEYQYKRIAVPNPGADKPCKALSNIFNGLDDPYKLVFLETSRLAALTS